MRYRSKASLFVGALLSIACGDDGGDSGGDAGAQGDGGGSAGGGSTDSGCEALCTGAGFASGDEMDFGSGVIECMCGGAGAGIAQTDCTAYCADFDVAADKSYLSTEATANDKCVCDGTQP